MGRTLPLTARSTGVRTNSNERPAATTLLDQCVSTQRRAVLAVLCESGSLSLDALARRVAARRQGVSVTEVSDDAREQAEIGLYHNHLQKLSEAGLVERADEGDGTTVTLTPFVDHDRIRDLIEIGEGSWATLDAVLGNDRRRHVTTVLASADEPPTLDELAEAVATLEREEAGIPHGETVESVRVSLHHAHLPELDDAGVLDYDSEEGRVTLGELPDAYEAAVDDEPKAAPA